MAERNPRIPHSIESLLFVNRNGKYCGYKLELISDNISADLREFLICAECEGISRRPRNCGGNTVCEVCVPGHSMGDINKRVGNTVASLNVKCPLSGEGCIWKGKLGGIEEHLEECLKVGVEYQLGCDIPIERGPNEQDNREVRQLKMKRCDYCNQDVQANEENRHKGKCQRHPDTEVPCPYKELGCEAIMLRKNRAIHITENMTSHNKLMQDKINPLNQLRNKNQQLDRINQQQKNRNEELERVNVQQKNKSEELEGVNVQQKNTNEQQKNRNEELKRLNVQQENRNQQQERANEQQKIRNEDLEGVNKQQKNRNEELERINEQPKIRNEELERVNEQQNNRSNELEIVNQQQKNWNEELERFNEQQKNGNEELESVNVQQENRNQQQERANEQQKIKNTELERANEQQKVRSQRLERVSELQKIRNQQLERVNELQMIRNEELERVNEQLKIRNEELNNMSYWDRVYRYFK